MIKKKVLPLLSIQKTWLIILLNVPLGSGLKPRILSLCAFFFVHIRAQVWGQIAMFPCNSCSLGFTII